MGFIESRVQATINLEALFIAVEYTEAGINPLKKYHLRNIKLSIYRGFGFELGAFTVVQHFRF